jgi:hypothetical protein
MTKVLVLIVVVAGTVVATLAAAVRALVNANAAIRLRRQIRAAPQQIADLSIVTLTGTVRLEGEPLIAPLSGRPCVFHRSTVRTYRPGARRNSRILDGEHTRVELVPFVLVTREGDALVDGDHAEVPGAGRAIIPRKIALERKFLAEYAPDKNARGSGFEEVVIVPGTTISVHGVARVEVEPAEAGYRETATRVRLVAGSGQPLTIVPA